MDFGGFRIEIFWRGFFEFLIEILAIFGNFNEKFVWVADFNLSVRALAGVTLASGVV